jgi:uncharacterized Zn finger protein
MPSHRGTDWKLACPKCGTPSDEVELEWGDEEPDFTIHGDVTLSCDDCGHAEDVEGWEWKRV